MESQATRGDTISLIYDLAGRMLRREYSTPLEDGLPTGPVADQDVFTYDAASRMLTFTLECGDSSPLCRAATFARHGGDLR